MQGLFCLLWSVIYPLLGRPLQGIFLELGLLRSPVFVSFLACCLLPHYGQFCLSPSRRRELMVVSLALLYPRLLPKSSFYHSDPIANCHQFRLLLCSLSMCLLRGKCNKRFFLHGSCASDDPLFFRACLLTRPLDASLFFQTIISSLSINYP